MQEPSLFRSAAQFDWGARASGVDEALANWIQRDPEAISSLHGHCDFARSGARLSLTENAAADARGPGRGQVALPGWARAAPPRRSPRYRWPLANQAVAAAPARTGATGPAPRWRAPDRPP